MVESSVMEVRGQVEAALQMYFGRRGENQKYAGKLSVYLDLVDPDINHTSLRTECEFLSNELSEGLQIIGLSAGTYRSDSGSFDHVFLQPDDDIVVPDEQVIIDVTLGQYVVGHNHTFVGTRASLRDLVVNRTGAGEKYSLTDPFEVRSKFEPIELFKRTWGDTSIRFESTVGR